MKRILLFILVAVAVTIAWKVTHRRPRAAGPLLPLAPMVAAGPLGVGGGAVDAKGRVWLWGEARAAVAGTPKQPFPRRQAVRAEGIDDVVQLVVGPRVLLALLRDGTVHGTGCNAWGLLGVPSVPLNACTPHDEWLPLPGLEQVVQLSSGGTTAYAVRRDGSVWSWGRDEAGTRASLAARVPSLVDVKAMVLEGGVLDHPVTYAIRRDGGLWAWGSSYRLGLWNAGEPAAHARAVPLPLQDLGGVSMLPPTPLSSVNGGAMAVVRQDGSVLHFGAATSSLCEQPDGQPMALPMTVPGLQGIAQVAVMTGAILAMGQDGSLWRWGDRVMDSTTSRRQGCMETAEALLPPGSITALTASSLAALAFQRDGTVLAWGLDVVLNAGSMNIPMAWSAREVVGGMR